MDASAPRSALFAPGSPEEKWLETVIHEAAPGHGGRRDLTPALAGPALPRQLFESLPLPPPQSSQSPESANAAVGKATVWSAPRGDASSIVHTHSSSQTPGKLASVVVSTKPLPRLTQLTLPTRENSPRQPQQQPTPSCTPGSRRLQPRRQNCQQQRPPPQLPQRNSLRSKLQQASLRQSHQLTTH